jgi:hypothetical protein
MPQKLQSVLVSGCRFVLWMFLWMWAGEVTHWASTSIADNSF